MEAEAEAAKAADIQQRLGELRAATQVCVWELTPCSCGACGPWPGALKLRTPDVVRAAMPLKACPEPVARAASTCIIKLAHV